MNKLDESTKADLIACLVAAAIALAGWAAWAMFV